MNRKILQKVIDALKEKKPDLSYIRGALETLIEGLPPESVTYPPIIDNVTTNQFKPALMPMGNVGTLPATPEQASIDAALDILTIKPKPVTTIEKNITLN